MQAQISTQNVSTCFCDGTILKLFGFMSRALLGASSASSFGLLVHLLHHFASPDVPPPLDFSCPVCLDGLHWPSLGLGVLIGFLVWPALELLLYIRAFLLQVAANRLHGRASFSYRLLT
ncbi:unnamed protein product [Symbiodinium sp. CCMP2592]|nr:unnamed protein product [Symbiodinium sp. CCMP2592]